MPACRVLVVSILLSALLSGCRTSQPSGPSESTFVDLVMPRAIEVQSFTRPADLLGRGEPDSLEVFIETQDAGGDGTKTLGVFQFELHTRRYASGDRLGERVAYWRVELNDPETVDDHWDHLSRFYRFELALPEMSLRPGEYILTAQLEAPSGERLFDEYEMSYGVAPTDGT